MRIAEFERMLSSPALSAVIATDSSSNRLVQVAIALKCALEEVASPDAERQLRQLVWMLCSRSGGGICRAEHVMQDECNKKRGCACSQIDGSGLYQ